MIQTLQHSWQNILVSQRGEHKIQSHYLRSLWWWQHMLDPSSSSLFDYLSVSLANFHHSRAWCALPPPSSQHYLMAWSGQWQFAHFVKDHCPFGFFCLVVRSFSPSLVESQCLASCALSYVCMTKHGIQVHLCGVWLSVELNVHLWWASIG